MRVWSEARAGRVGETARRVEDVQDLARITEDYAWAPDLRLRVQSAMGGR